MMKIGIVLRNLDNKYETLNNDIIEYLNKYKCILIGIVVNQNFSNIKNIIDECSGVILPGGKYEEENDKFIIKYLYETNKPTLGICLGAEEMAKCFNGNLVKMDKNNHNSKQNYAHLIHIVDKSLLKRIINKDYIIVNSRHEYKINNTELKVSAYSDDYVIEAIEAENRKFFLGVSYHPESIKNDINSKNLINYFLDVCKENYKLN